MSSSNEGRVVTICRLFSTLVIPDTLFRDLDLAGARPCSLLLQRAIRHQQNNEWECCQEVAFKAREFSWEQLHRCERGGQDTGALCANAGVFLNP